MKLAYQSKGKDWSMPRYTSCQDTASLVQKCPRKRSNQERVQKCPKVFAYQLYSIREMHGILNPTYDTR